MRKALAFIGLLLIVALPVMGATWPTGTGGVPGGGDIVVRGDLEVEGTTRSDGYGVLILEGDIPTFDAAFTGQDAWPQATSNTDGGAYIIAGGMGIRNYELVNRANTGGDTYDIWVDNGSQVTLTEGVDFTCVAAASDLECLNNMASAIEAGVSEIDAVVVAPKVLLNKAQFEFRFAMKAKSSDATGIKANEGTDGAIRLSLAEAQLITSGTYTFEWQDINNAMVFRVDASTATPHIALGFDGTLAQPAFRFASGDGFYTSTAKNTVFLVAGGSAAAQFNSTGVTSALLSGTTLQSTTNANFLGANNVFGKSGTPGYFAMHDGTPVNQYHSSFSARPQAGDIDYLLPVSDAAGVFHSDGGGDLSWSAVDLAADVGSTILPIANGGTNASDAGSARTSLGLVIGTNVQAWDTDLDTYSGKTPPSGDVVGTSDTQTLTNKSITNPIITQTSSNVSNPPTDGELDALFGEPGTVGAGFQGVVDDSDSNNVYLCISDGTNWFTIAGVLAT